MSKIDFPQIVRNRIGPKIRRAIDHRYFAKGIAAKISSESGLQVSLPFPAPIAHQTYLSPAFALGVLMSLCEVQHLLANHYIQWAFPSGDDGRHGNAAPIIVQAPTLEHFAMLEYIDRLDHGHLVSRSRADLMIRRIICALEKGHYLSANVNEYYVPETWSFRTRDYRHPCLITGLSSGQFTIITYRRDMNLGAIALDGLQLAKALVSRGRFDRVSIPYHGTPRHLFEIVPKEDLWLPLCPFGIRVQLEDYLRSRRPTTNYLEFISRPGGRKPIQQAEIPHTDWTFGIAAWPLFGSYFQEVAAGRRMPDPRFSKILNEHKSIMQKRLTLLQEWTTRSMADEFRIVAAWAKAVHLQCVRLLNGERPGSNFGALTNKWPEMMRQENELLTQLVGLLPEEHQGAVAPSSQ